MKKNSFFFIIFSLFLLFSPGFQLRAETIKGFEECEILKTFLQKNNISYIEMPLIHAGHDLFPYSLKVDFFTENEDKANLYFIFNLDEALQNSDLILSAMKSISSLYIKESAIHFVFSYGDKIKNFEEYTISGIKNLTDTLEISEKDGIFCFSFNKNLNTIITGGGGTTSPAFLISLASDAFFESRLFYIIQGGILSSFYRSRILKEDSSTSLLLENSICAAGIQLYVENSPTVDYQKKLNTFFEYLANNFTSGEKVLDRHSYTIKIGTFSLTIPEKVTVTALIITIFVTIFSLCFIPFLNKKAKRNFSKNILKAWISIPGRVFFTAASFLIGQFFAYLFMKAGSNDPYIQLSIKFFTGFAIITFSYLLSLKFHFFQPASYYSYLLPVTSVVNIFVFSALDISLFYLFTFEYLIIYLSRVMKRSVSLVIALFLLALPFLPYLFQLVLYANPEQASRIVFCSLPMNVIVSMAFMPFEYTWLRLLLRLNAVWKRVEKKRRTFIRQNVIAISISVSIFTLILLLTAIFIPEEYKLSDKNFTKESLIDDDNKYIHLQCDDFENFKNFQRSIHVHLNENFENVRLSVKGENSNPLVYSEYSYITDKENKTDTFMLPVFPPKDFEITFITDDLRPSSIIVEAIKYNEAENKVLEVKKIFKLPETYMGEL
ncbi:MAG: hypothetical protein K6F15_08490 [Treponema sp.]|nr:hypothetical protein [Treponema sp.]